MRPVSSLLASYSTPGPTTASLPAAPPLQPFSFVDSPSPSSGFLTPNPSSDTPSTDAGVFTPQSTISTAFTTPESSKTLWGDSQQQLRRVGEAAAKPPIGFEFLDGEFEKETGSLAPRSLYAAISPLFPLFLRQFLISFDLLQ